MQQWLGQAVTEQRKCRGRASVRNVPDNTIGESNEHLARSCEATPQGKVVAAVTKPTTATQRKCFRWTTRSKRPSVVVLQVRAAEELGIKCETFGRDVERRQEQLFHRILITRRVHISDLQRGIERQHNLAIFVRRSIFGQPLTPTGILQIGTIAKLMPLMPTSFTIHKVHELVRRGIVWWHRWTVRIERIVVPTSRVDVDVEALWERPPGIGRFLRDHARNVLVCLLTIERTTTA